MPTACGAIVPGMALLGRLRAGAARGRAPAHLLAGSVRHVLPVLGRVVARGLAGARVARGAAIVLPGLGDAVALLAVRVAVVGEDGLRGADGEDSRHGGFQPG